MTNTNVSTVSTVSTVSPVGSYLPVSRFTTVLDVVKFNYSNYDAGKLADGDTLAPAIVEYNGKTKYISPAKAVSKKQVDACGLVESYEKYLDDVDSLSGALYAIWVKSANTIADLCDNKKVLSADIGAVDILLPALRNVFIGMGMDKKQRLNIMFNADLPKDERLSDSEMVSLFYNLLAPLFLGTRTDKNGVRVVCPVITSSEKAKHKVTSATRGGFENAIARLVDGAKIAELSLDNILEQSAQDARDDSAARKEQTAKIKERKNAAAIDAAQKAAAQTVNQAAAAKAAKAKKATAAKPAKADSAA